jgi:hypothetical protein
LVHAFGASLSAEGSKPVIKKLYSMSSCSNLESIILSFNILSCKWLHDLPGIPHVTCNIQDCFAVDNIAEAVNLSEELPLG